MSAEKNSNFGFDYFEKGRSVVEDKFVGREAELNAFSEILEYPLRGKEMPVLLVKGISGTGKSWLLSKFAGRLDAERLPYVASNLRSPISGNLPGAWFGLSEEISTKYKLETPRFNRVADIFDRRFRGIVREETVEPKGFFRGFIDQFKGGGQQEELTSPKMYREYGKDWEAALTSRPMHEHLRAMALALAEDIDYGLDRKKYPFLTIILDSWNITTARQAPLWKALAQNSSRLFMIVALQGPADFPGAREITLYDFNERETREALERRGIASPKAIADIMGKTGGSPLGVSLAASLAELVSRKGDVIRADTFSVLSEDDPAETYCKRCWELLRDSEQFALCAAVRSPGLPAELMAELHAQRADLPAGLLSAIDYIPFDPPLSPASPVKTHEDVFDTIESLSHGVAFTNIADLARRTERLLENENLLDWEVLLGRLEIRIEPETALSLVFERIMALRASGEFSAAESLWRCSHPEGNVGLAVIHRLIGFELLNDYLTPAELKVYYRQETESVITDSEHIIQYSSLIWPEDTEEALRQLQDCVGSLSASITETSGKEPALWFLRGKALLLADHILFKSNVFREVVSSAQKAHESFEKAIEGGLNPAGLLSLECARAALLIAKAKNELGELKQANLWLTKGLEQLDASTAKRRSFTADLSLVKADILFMQGEILLKKDNGGEAEESFNYAIDELNNIADDYRVFNAVSARKTGEIHLALARLLQKSGSSDSALQAINSAREAYSRYESAIGGGDYQSWIGRGDILTITAELTSAEDTSKALGHVRKAIEYYDKAWADSEPAEAVEREIDALILQADLMTEDGKDSEADVVFDKVEKLILTRLSSHGTKISSIMKNIALAKSRGRSAYLRGNNDLSAIQFADAVRGYADLNEISPDLPDVYDLAEVHLAAAMAFRSGGEPVEALRSLRRALDSYEFLADKNTERGRKKVLSAAIGIYNDLSATGLEEECFETSLFILALITQVGGQEAISIGHELLEYWMGQDLSFTKKHKLEEVASTLQEYWGE